MVKRKDPTKCASGLHPWIPENIVKKLSGTQCRLCNNAATRKAMRKIRAKAKETT